MPQLEIVDGLLYLNTGDWVENASLVMETADGDIELFNHDCLVEKISKQELSDKTNSSLEPRIPDLERCPTPINEFSLEGLANEFRIEFTTTISKQDEHTQLFQIVTYSFVDSTFCVDWKLWRPAAKIDFHSKAYAAIAPTYYSRLSLGSMFLPSRPRS